MSGTTTSSHPLHHSPLPPTIAYPSPTPVRKGSRLLTILLSLLALIALIHFIAVVHVGHPATPPHDCSSLLRYNDYTKTVPFQPQTQEMAAVQFVDEITGGQPAVLVQVRDKSPRHLLDVYIYGCSMQLLSAHKPDAAHPTPALTLLFKQQRLIQGTVSITGAHTLSVSQLDTTLPQDAGVLMQPLQQNIYREYTWRNGSFIQTLFPGLYPVLSRSEAEELQEQANDGQRLPWNDPLTTTTQMAKDLLRWSSNAMHASVQDNDGTTAHVLLIQDSPRIEVTVTLIRLIRRDNTGLWFVTAAQSSGITLNRSPLPLPATSPFTIHGTIQSGDGDTTTVLFDHSLTSMKILNAPSLTMDETGAYSETISYSNGISNQPGLFLLEETPPPDSTEQGQLLLSNILLG